MKFSNNSCLNPLYMNIMIKNIKRGVAMRKNKKVSFQELIKENKRELLNNPEAIERIEKRIDDKHYRRLKENL